MALMVKKSDTQNRFFYGQCGDWEGVASASNPRKACSLMIDQAGEVFKDKMKTTDVMVVMDLQAQMNHQDDIAISAFSTKTLERELP
tara:strand:+ start:180 stop:440 length:261 start_codon:yes stop_codon:yes gene_type:complete